MESGKCLGEIGSSDLTTLVLTPENNFLISMRSGNAINTLIKTSLTVLSDLVTSDNFHVKKAASDCLRGILKTRQSTEVLKNNTNVLNFKYLEAFVTRGSVNLEFKIKRNVLVDKMKGFDWLTLNDHKKWIVDFVQALLKSLSDTEGITESFRKMIQVHWQFSEKILVSIFDLILNSCDKICTNVLIKSFQFFFEKNFTFDKIKLY